MRLVVKEGEEEQVWRKRYGFIVRPVQFGRPKEHSHGDSQQRDCNCRNIQHRWHTFIKKQLQQRKRDNPPTPGKQ